MPFGSAIGRPVRRQWHHGEMIMEHALLSVKPGRSAEFVSAFEEAKAIIAGMPGFHGLRLSRCLERPDGYLLMVTWERVEDHTIGFRQSRQYEEWRQLLHHFYDPFPTVEHYEEVLSVQGP